MVSCLLLGKGLFTSWDQIYFEDEDITYRANKVPGCGGISIYFEGRFLTSKGEPISTLRETSFPLTEKEEIFLMRGKIALYPETSAFC